MSTNACRLDNVNDQNSPSFFSFFFFPHKDVEKEILWDAKLNINFLAYTRNVQITWSHDGDDKGAQFIIYLNSKKEKKEKTHGHRHTCFSNEAWT